MMVTAKQKILALYISFSSCVVLSCLPDVNMQNLSLVLGVLSLIAAYVVRQKAGLESLEGHHATFVIRTIWIWSLFFSLGLIGAGIALSVEGDMTPVDRFIEGAMNGAVPDEASMRGLMEEYFLVNRDLMIRLAILWLAPAQIYAVWRLARGGERAIRGYRLKDVRSWF